MIRHFSMAAIAGASRRSRVPRRTARACARAGCRCSLASALPSTTSAKPANTARSTSKEAKRWPRANTVISAGGIPASVHKEGLSGHEIRRLAGQEDARAYEVRGLRVAAHRDARQNELHAFLVREHRL